MPESAPSVWNTLKIGGVPMPGTVQEVDVGGKLREIREDVAGQSGTTVAGADWDDDTAAFEIWAHSEEDWANFSRLLKAYKAKPGQKPKPAEVLHPLLQAFGIRAMFVSSLRARWSVREKKNVLVINLELTNIAPKKEVDKTEQNSEAVTPGQGIPEGPDAAAGVVPTAPSSAPPAPRGAPRVTP